MLQASGGETVLQSTTQQAAASDSAATSAPVNMATVPQDPMRAYRACLHCRSRKTKCTLDLNGGRPPCRRCQREQRECVLGESHRGGRRVRKKPKVPDQSVPEQISQPSGNINEFPTGKKPEYGQQYKERPGESNDPYSATYDPRYSSWPNRSARAESETSGFSRNGGQRSPTTSTYHPGAQSEVNVDPQLDSHVPGRESIVSSDLQNPSDALDILARVADRAEGDLVEAGQNVPSQAEMAMTMQWRSSRSPPKDQFYYKPMMSGVITPEMIYHLFSIFEEFYHPFFPIIRRETFNPQRLMWLSKAEPHLFSAILTVASKDNELVHHICYDHMQELISMILAGADVDVEAVEALLLLSQWVSHRPQADIAVGRGEEDRVAWMYVGTALRLGYFLGIDRTAFKGDPGDDAAKFHRKRLAWTACYVCDRSVSVRLGKGFWARGPGPLSGIRSSDFPSLQPLLPGDDNWAMIFQANLELTQIFGNVFDILYSSKGSGWKEMLEGRYIKYLDDFRTSIRNWNDAWGNLPCSPKLKGSLLLTYHYLRLYANAFAYQATISRTMIFSRESQTQSIPYIDAAAPDARFIYDAVDAAKSLLNTFNTFLAPDTVRYMPSSYYLYIIYSAVFLYKARSTTAMSSKERSSIRDMINQTIDRLQETSIDAKHMGSRYSRLLQLLWRKAPQKNDTRDILTQATDSRFQIPQPAAQGADMLQTHATGLFSGMDMNAGDDTMAQGYGNGTFSWLDLGAAWTFATQNNSTSISIRDMDDMVGDSSSGLTPYDMDLNQMTDYRLLADDNPNLIF